MNTIRLCTAALLMLVASLASAQIYQALDKDGKPLPMFTDQPQKVGGRVVEVTPIESNTLPGAEIQQDIENDEQVIDIEADERAAQLKLLQDSYEQALLDLEKAKAMQQQGTDYKDGDRVGKVGGGARLSEQYFERQATLKSGVRLAEERVEQLDNQIGELEGDQ